MEAVDGLLLVDWAEILSYKEKIAIEFFFRQRTNVKTNEYTTDGDILLSHKPELLPREDFLYHRQRLSCSSLLEMYPTLWSLVTFVLLMITFSCLYMVIKYIHASTSIH